jgi:hypothetical protein
MKAINDNGTIKTFSSVPKSWNGKIGLQYASDSDLEALGFYDVEQPIKKESQEYGDIEWDADNSRFTYQVNNKTYSQTVAELKEQKIANLKHLYNNKLAQTDWYVVRAAEGGTAVPSDIATERSDLRTQCATKESEINAKTTKAQVVDYQLPNLN